MDMMCRFDRSEYLKYADLFEKKEVRDFENELCEFNSDPEDLAAELAYTRYALAVAEKRQRPMGYNGRDWKIPEIAPKDGTLIVARFKSYPTPLAAMWNGHDQEWVAASPQVEPVNGVWNDWYFENERFKNEELTAWAKIDEAE